MAIADASTHNRISRHGASAFIWNDRHDTHVNDRSSPLYNTSVHPHNDTTGGGARITTAAVPQSTPDVPDSKRSIDRSSIPTTSMAPLRPTHAAAAARRFLTQALQARPAPQQPARSLGTLVRRRPAAAAVSASAAAGAPPSSLFWNYTAAAACAPPAWPRRGLASSPAAAASPEEEQQQQQQRRVAGSTEGSASSSAPAQASSSADAPSSSTDGVASVNGSAAAARASERLLRRAGRPAPIQLTERAVARIKELLAEKAEASGGALPLGVRLGIRRRELPVDCL